MKSASLRTLVATGVAGVTALVTTAGAVAAPAQAASSPATVKVTVEPLPGCQVRMSAHISAPPGKRTVPYRLRIGTWHDPDESGEVTMDGSYTITRVMDGNAFLTVEVGKNGSAEERSDNAAWASKCEKPASGMGIVKPKLFALLETDGPAVADGCDAVHRWKGTIIAGQGVRRLRYTWFAARRVPTEKGTRPVYEEKASTVELPGSGEWRRSLGRSYSVKDGNPESVLLRLVVEELEGVRAADGIGTTRNDAKVSDHIATNYVVMSVPADCRDRRS